MAKKTASKTGHTRPAEPPETDKTINELGKHRDISQRKRSDSIIRRRLELAEAIIVISSRFVGVIDIDDAIHAALADIGRLSGAKRAVLGLYNIDDPSLGSIYAWDKGTRRRKANIQRNIAVSRWPWWEEKLNRGEIIYLTDTSTLPVEASAERESFIERGTKSLLSFPLRITGKPAGFLSLSNITNTADWGDEELSVIKMAIEIIGTAFERQHAAMLRRTLVNSAPMGIYIVLKGKFVFVNPEFQRVTGYTEAELLGTESLQLVHPDDRELVVTNAVAMLKGTRPDPYEFRIINKSGETIWTMETAASIRFDGMRATLGFFADISTQRATTQALRNSEEKLRSMFESISDGIIIVNLDGTIADVNEKTLKMHGFKSKDDIIGKNVAEFVVTGEGADWAKDTPKVIELSKLEHHEMQILKADGTQFTGEISNSICRDADGNPTCFVFITRDITERKQAEAALAIKNALLEAASETTIDGIVAVDTNLRIIMSNKRFQEMFQLPQKLIDAGEYYPILDHVISRIKDPEEYLQSVNKSIEDGRLKFRHEIETRDGRAIDRYSTPMLDEDGHNYGRITYFRDITDQKNAVLKEQELREEVNRASRLASIGEMSAGIAHEINNPLTSVIGFAQLLLSRDIPDDMRDELAVINQEAQRVARVVEGMLTFARGNQNGEEPIDINRIISQALEMRAYQMKVNNIRYTTKFADGLPPVPGNANQLKQVFINIILNAEKVMSNAHGRGNLTIVTERAGNIIRVSLTDDGPGIPPENLDKIFDPFFTTSEVGSGTGLGLSICHGIITAHQGKIYARSQVERGATFIIELPVPADSETEGNTTAYGGETGQLTAIAEPPETPSTPRALIVDDEPSISNLLQRILHEQGFDVTAANTSYNAVENLHAHHFDLILMDIKMPMMNGIEMYKLMQKINPEMACKVIFITGDILEPSTRSFFKKYRTPYIAKPIDMEKLQTAINSIVPGTNKRSAP